MPIAIGGNNITDIKVGSTAINSVHVGSQLVWARVTLSVSPSTNVTALNDLNTSPFATAIASATISTSSSVTWQFTQVSGATANTGSTSGTSTIVSLGRAAASGAGTTTSVVRVSAYVGGSFVSSSTITLNAIQDHI